MRDLLFVSFDRDEKTNEIGLVVGRPLGDDEHEILKMELDEQAEILYRILTNQSVKIASIHDSQKGKGTD